jgi:hypothetical protein
LKTTRDKVLQELIDLNYGLLPITIDPGGKFGPLSSEFLWQAAKTPTAALQSKSRSSTGLSKDTALSLARKSTHAYHKFALLQRANMGWHEAHNGQWYTRSYTAITPSQWAIQVMSQNLLLAIAGHLQVAISHCTIHTSSRPHTLFSAAINPRLARPTFALPSIYRLTSIYST